MKEGGTSLKFTACQTLTIRTSKNKIKIYPGTILFQIYSFSFKKKIPFCKFDSKQFQELPTNNRISIMFYNL